jgi:hypothetical protein
MKATLACLLLLLGGLAQAQASDEAERARIRQKRAAIEAEHAQREKTCRGQFVVTPCIEKSRADKQQVLHALQVQEQALDDALRRQRAQEQARRMRDKTQAAQERGEKTVPAKAPKAPRTASSKSAKPPSVKASAADRSATEKRKREAFEARQREIKAHKDEVAKRNAERAKRKPPQPLPLPASAPKP